jgi:hypothetical protein
MKMVAYKMERLSLVLMPVHLEHGSRAGYTDAKTHGLLNFMHLTVYPAISWP